MKLKIYIYIGLTFILHYPVFSQNKATMKSSGDTINLKLAKEHIKKGTLYKILWDDLYEHIAFCENKVGAKYGLKIEDQRFFMCGGYVPPPIGVIDYINEIKKHLDSLYSPIWKIYYEKEFEYCMNREYNKEAVIFGNEYYKTYKFPNYAGVYFLKGSNRLKKREKPLIKTLIQCYTNNTKEYEIFIYSSGTKGKKRKMLQAIFKIKAYLLKRGVKEEDIKIENSEIIKKCNKCPQINISILNTIYLHIGLAPY